MKSHSKIIGKGILTATAASYSIGYATNETGYKVIDVQN